MRILLKVDPNIKMGTYRLLELIRLGIENGNTEAVLAIIDDVLAQFPPDEPTQSRLN